MRFPKKGSKVYIIESPKPKEILHNIGEAKSIKSIFDLFQVDCDSYLVINKMTFRMCMEAIAKDVLECDKEHGSGINVYLHISCHGDDDSLILTSDILRWFYLAEELFRLNEAIGYYGNGDDRYGRCTVCLSACQGLAAKAIEQFNFHSPYSVMVCSQRKPTWQETVTAFASFYYSAIFMNSKGSVSISNMNKSIGQDELFIYTFSSNFLKAIDNHLRKKAVENLLDASKADNGEEAL